MRFSSKKTCLRAERDGAEGHLSSATPRTAAESGVQMTEAATRTGYMEIFARATPDKGRKSGGKAPYTYQWQTKNKDAADWSNLSNNAVIEGAKTAELLTIMEKLDFTCGYQYHCVITDADENSVTADVVTVLEKTSTSGSGPASSIPNRRPGSLHRVGSATGCPGDDDTVKGETL